MKTRHLLSFLLASLILSGCSFQHYFILTNSSKEVITINYSLIDPTNDKALFEIAGEVYQSKKDHFPNWEKRLPYLDLDNSESQIQIQLEPNSTLVFGTLRNENYDKTSMKCSGNTIFNLKEMTFSVNGKDYLISKDNFHDFFLEDGGTFKHVIK